MNGLGKSRDGARNPSSSDERDVNGVPINPTAREYPRDFIQTGISVIDGMTTLIQGQKLPIFSGNGMDHNQLAAQIVRQAKVRGGKSEFAIVFAAMGVKYDVAKFFIDSFEETGVLDNVALFLSLADDPSIERTITPRTALTLAEHLAFDKGKQVLVIMTDMTNYCESLREISTEGQIVFDRDMHGRGIYPPINCLPSLSRLMKDGIGEGMTRDDHPHLSNQLFASYSHVKDVRNLASVIGEEELTETDHKYLEFGEFFEKRFVSQRYDEDRSIEETLDLGWQALSILTPEELQRLTEEEISAHYKG